jgi:hypothetical protein
MPLPTIATPTYELELPSNGKTIKFRPFLVKEEKLLVLALESENIKEISNAIKTVLSNCIQTKGIKVENLPTFDIEYLFLNIRGKSVGEQIEVNLIAPDDEQTSVPVMIDIDEIKVKKVDGHTNKIKLDENLVLELKYPSLEQFIKSNFNFGEDTSIDESFGLIASCVDKIYNDEEVWSSADVTKKELVDFLEQMNSVQFKDVEKFFLTMPKLSHEVTFTNPKTKVESTVVLEGLSSFFA